MEMKSKLTLAALICVGLLATGCSQQQAAGSQQVAQQQTCDCGKDKPVTPPPVPVQPPVKRPPPPVKPVTPVAPVVPPVKAKGNFKGAVKMDESSKAVMQQYQR